MTILKMAPVLILLTVPALAQQSDDSCAPAGGLEFICGVENAEDLVLVPGTDWIISSGMTPGAGLGIIDSRDNSWSVLYPGSNPQAEHDPMYADCTDPPNPATFNTHGLSIRAA